MKKSDLSTGTSMALRALTIAMLSMITELVTGVASDAKEPSARLIYNLDDGAAFGQPCVLRFGMPTPRVPTSGVVIRKRLDGFVKDLAQSGVTDFFICVNSQRTTYKSDVWDSF